MDLVVYLGCKRSRVEWIYGEIQNKTGDLGSGILFQEFSGYRMETNLISRLPKIFAMGNFTLTS